MSAPPSTCSGSGPALCCHIDRPKRFDRFPSPLLRVQGWCFASEGPQVCSVRVRCKNGLILTAPISRPRPEVRATHPDAPGDFVGFDLRGILPSGHQTLTFEALLEDGTHQFLFNRQVRVPKKCLPLWLRPASFWELFESQVSNQPLYPPRPIKLESFPILPPKDRIRDGSPRFAIVTPSYNQAHWLSETMASRLRRPRRRLDRWQHSTHPPIRGPASRVGKRPGRRANSRHYERLLQNQWRPRRSHGVD